MISLQLCQKLKEAGFLQDGKGEIKLIKSCPHWMVKTKKYPHGDISRQCKCWSPYVPTLSELIEACGEQFDILQKNGKRPWQAYDKYCHAIGYGDIPEEAVANLWLILKI